MTAKWNQWADQKSAGRCKEACDNITGIVVISRKCGLIHTCDNNFSKVILCRACTLSWIQPSVHLDSVGEVRPLCPSCLSLQCRDLARLISVVFSTSEFLFPPLLFRSWFFPRERAPTDPASLPLSQVFLTAHHLLSLRLRLFRICLHSMMLI